MYNKHESKPILHGKWGESKAGYIIERKIEARDKFYAKVKLTVDDLKLIPWTE